MISCLFLNFAISFRNDNVKPLTNSVRNENSKHMKQNIQCSVTLNMYVNNMKNAEFSRCEVIDY